MGGLISRIFRRKTTDDESRPKSKKGRRFGSFRRPKSEEPQTSIHQSRCNTLPSRTPISQIENDQTIEREEGRRKTMQEVQNSTGTSSHLSGFTGETAQIPCTGKQESEQNSAQNQLDLTEQTENVNAERYVAVEAVSLASEAPNQNNHQPPIGKIQTMWMTEQDDMVQVQLEANGETAFVIPDKAEIAQSETEFQKNISQDRCQRESVTHESNAIDIENEGQFEAESVKVKAPIIPEYSAETQQETASLQNQPEEINTEDHEVEEHTKEHVEVTATVPIGEKDAEVPSELQHETPTHQTQPEWTTKHDDQVHLEMHLESDEHVGTTSAIAGDDQIAQPPSELVDEIAIGDAQPVLATEYEDKVHAVSESHAEATPIVPVGEEDAEVPSELQHETPTHETQPEWTIEHEFTTHTGSSLFLSDEVGAADSISDFRDDPCSHICLEETESSSFAAEGALPVDDTGMGYFERNAFDSPPDLIAHHDDDADLGDGEMRTPSSPDITEPPAASYAQSVSSLQAVFATCPEHIPSTVDDALDKTTSAALIDTSVGESPSTRLLDTGESQAEATKEAEENMCGDQNFSMRHTVSLHDESIMGTTAVPDYQPCSSDSLTDVDHTLENASFVHSVIQGTASADDDTASPGVTITPEVKSEAAPDTSLTAGFEQGTPTTSDLVAHSLVDDILDHAACSVPDDTADSDLRMAEEHVYNDGDSSLLDNREPAKLQINGNCTPSLNGNVHENSSEKEHWELGMMTTTTKQTDIPLNTESFDITADAMPQESAPNPTDA
ncbi:hypothetical protein P879_05162 [Paragonimus westermani]|uniref:Uncharacterized protein n=1 Tax=Paragonimus westermani TaxID=34504 RepID=A0A8T0DBW9_9TREM|nr:hypothetical protein P879_05162 [Paragonimus westermani]